MLVNILDLLRGYHLSGTWQYWVVTRVRAVAVLIDHPALRAAIDAALPVVEHANKLRRQYTIAKGRHVGSDAAVLLDRRIDRLVAGAHGMIELLVRQGGERSHAAALLLEQAFPSGLAAHVNATFFAQVDEALGAGLGR